MSNLVILRKPQTWQHLCFSLSRKARSTRVMTPNPNRKMEPPLLFSSFAPFLGKTFPTSTPKKKAAQGLPAFQHLRDKKKSPGGPRRLEAFHACTELVQLLRERIMEFAHGLAAFLHAGRWFNGEKSSKCLGDLSRCFFILRKECHFANSHLAYSTVCECCSPPSSTNQSQKNRPQPTQKAGPSNEA